jgi:hypothetical protein
LRQRYALLQVPLRLRASVPSAQSVPLARVISHSRCRAPDARAGWPLRTAASTSSVSDHPRTPDVGAITLALLSGLFSLTYGTLARTVTEACQNLAVAWDTPPIRPAAG